MEEKRQKTEGGANKVYRGLPVTTISFILPLFFWLQFLMSDYVFLILLHGLLILVGTLFVLDFPLKKPDIKTILIAIVAVIVTVFIIQTYTKFKLPESSDESSQIIGEIFEDETKAP